MKPPPQKPTIQPAKIENSTSIPSNILSKIANHPIASLIALIASLLGIGAVIHDALRDPDILSDLNPDVSQPFAFPFIIKNNSWIAMHDAQMYCGIEKVTINNSPFEGFYIVDISPSNIGPGEVVNFRCGAAGAGRNLLVAKPGDILDARINISVKYTMLWVPRTSTSTEFTWYTGGTPPHWIKGRIAD